VTSKTFYPDWAAIIEVNDGIGFSSFFIRRSGAAISYFPESAIPSLP
jgi:hypothetical protein